MSAPVPSSGASDTRSQRGQPLSKEEKRNDAALSTKAAEIASRLHEIYGSPNHHNKKDPVDELIFIILSQMTTSKSYRRVFDRLKSHARTWDILLSMPVNRLKTIIKDAGLSGQKAPRIQAILRRIYKDFGSISLRGLLKKADREVESYLTALPGVGLKTAKCVMMYSMRRQVLPVDTHVWRVSRRLGLVDDSMPYSQIHDALENVVAPEERYSFHVNVLSHGQAVCLDLHPRCHGCVLRNLCRHPKTKLPRRRKNL